MHVLLELENEKSPKIIFKDSGFNINALKEQKVYSSCSRWRVQYEEGDVSRLRDTRIMIGERLKINKRTLEE